MLPDMSAILDVAEVIATEHMDSEQLADWNRALYPPDPVARPGTLAEDGTVLVPPPGFDAEDEMAGFEAFAKMAG